MASPTAGLCGVMPAPVPAETLILVDVDGVLNVGLRDGSNHAVAFNSGNLHLASQWGEENPLAERLCSIASRRLEHGEGESYSEMVADSGDLSQLLVGRLARVIATAGQAGRVVLSSTWRRPSCRHKRKHLEASISQHLGRPFKFHGYTPDCSEHGAEDRLRILGDYISVFSAQRAVTAPKLRVLVLDDFSINSLTHVSCDGDAIGSAGGAEQYLLSRVGDTSCVSVRVVHTYDSWMTSKGYPVAIGCGLTLEHLCSAMSFLGGECEHCAKRMRDGYELKLGDTRMASKRSSSGTRLGRSFTQRFGEIPLWGRSNSM